MTAKDKLKYVKLSDITFSDRTRVDLGNIEELVESIRDKGIIQPITLDTQLHLLAGGRRFTAATTLGMEVIPALIREIDGILDAKEIELIENIHRKSFTWQEEAILTEQIDALYKEKHQATKDWSGRKTADLLDQSISMTSRNIRLAKAMEVLPQLKECKTADEALKMIKNIEEDAITQELRARQQTRIQLPEDVHPATGGATNRLERMVRSALKVADSNYMISDVFEGMAGMPTNGMVGLIECDPPYGVDLGKVKSKLNAGQATQDQQADYNEIPSKEYMPFLDKVTSELFRIAGKDCWLVFWFGQSWWTEVLSSLRNAGWSVDEIPAVWVKNQGQTLQPELYLARSWEPFFICRKGNPVMAHRGRLNSFSVPGCPTNGEGLDKKYHPTQRPQTLMKQIIDTLAVDGSQVFVPFLGSGATLRACYSLGFSGYGFDNNDAYKDKFMLAVEAETRAQLNEPEGE